MIIRLLKEILKEKVGEITIEDLKNKIKMLESMEEETIKSDDIDIDNYLRNASPTSIQITYGKFKRYHYFLKNKDKDLYVLRGGMYEEENDILDLEFFADEDEAIAAAEELVKQSYEYSGQMDTFIEQYKLENCGSYPDEYDINENMIYWTTYRVEKVTEESLKNIIENEGRGDYEWYLDYFKWFETCHK